MTYVRSRKFCCCLPVRFGVFVLTMLGLIGSVAVVVGGILRSNSEGGSDTDKSFLYIQIFIYMLLALISFFGFWGVISKHRKMVSIYFSMLVCHVVVSFATGVFALHGIFQDAPDTINICIGDSTSQAVIDSCTRGMSVMKGVSVAVFILVFLLEIYGCVIVDDYTKQLLDEEAASQKELDAENGRPQWQ